MKLGDMQDLYAFMKRNPAFEFRGERMQRLQETLNAGREDAEKAIVLCSYGLGK